ncbi:hypothetical protein KGF54_005109 [Candida jiufengensis]|uniref:uncharacterized protein n=1 Tax=Candida jiufengensis TaxID=497108 RepID=UPI002224950F|nr:uncharacterized protein KGF54_005109 [Candida jiufengensis]KAI5952034.1 hypothetical protein KGF54_005109 [Candida jiufengensis]
MQPHRFIRELVDPEYAKLNPECNSVTYEFNSYEECMKFVEKRSMYSTYVLQKSKIQKYKDGVELSREELKTPTKYFHLAECGYQIYKCHRKASGGSKSVKSTNSMSTNSEFNNGVLATDIGDTSGDVNTNSNSSSVSASIGEGGSGSTSSSVSALIGQKGSGSTSSSISDSIGEGGSGSISDSIGEGGSGSTSASIGEGGSGSTSSSISDSIGQKGSGSTSSSVSASIGESGSGSTSSSVSASIGEGGSGSTSSSISDSIGEGGSGSTSSSVSASIGEGDSGSTSSSISDSIGEGGSGSISDSIGEGGSGSSIFGDIEESCILNNLTESIFDETTTIQLKPIKIQLKPIKRTRTQYKSSIKDNCNATIKIIVNHDKHTVQFNHHHTHDHMSLEYANSLKLNRNLREFIRTKYQDNYTTSQILLCYKNFQVTAIHFVSAKISK